MYVLFWILNYQSRQTMAFNVMESEIEICLLKPIYGLNITLFSLPINFEKKYVYS